MVRGMQMCRARMGHQRMGQEYPQYSAFLGDISFCCGPLVGSTIALCAARVVLSDAVDTLHTHGLPVYKVTMYTGIVADGGSSAPA